MGVAGLWEVLRPAGQVRSLTELAVQDGFNANPSNQRGFRIGIDASIWFFHAARGREGENPELRTLFFRCCRLLQSPLLPLFVFDGPNRPAIKRGKRVGGNAHWLTQGMKNMIDAFGFEWWVAPGEAEAELAYLNRVGIIDAVLSDDVDNFLFGATMVIRNPSNTLSGNRANPVKNAQGKDDGNHVVTYTANVILSDPSVALSRPGTILIGLLSGGDYIPAGLPGCGQKFATGLARAGFGDSLLKAVKEYRGAKLDAFLDQWRQDIRNELRTNKSGLLPSKKPSLAASLPDDFPSLPVFMSYADPLTSENSPPKGRRKTPSGVWRDDPDPMRIASLCELYFEWGVKDVIVHRFRTVLWPGVVCRAVRRVIVDEDTRQRPNPCCPLDEEEEDIAGPSSPTKRITSAIATLALSSSNKSPAPGASTSDPPSSEPFTLSSLITLTSPPPPSPSRSTSPSSTSGPSPLLLEVLSQRAHASTDSILEYRVLVDPTILVERAESGVRGLRPPLIGGLFGTGEDEDSDTPNQDADESENDIERLETAAGAASKPGKKKRKARREVPTMPLRLWLPACMIQVAAPALVRVYEESAKAREDKRAKRGAKGARGGCAGTGIKSASRKTKVNDAMGSDDEGHVPGIPATKKVAVSKVKSRTVRKNGGGGKPKHAAEAQDEAYEYFDLTAGEGSCSSDGENAKNAKGRAKAKIAQTQVMKPTTEASVNTAGATQDFPSTTRPSTTRAAKLKPSASRPAASKHLYEKGEEESMDVGILPPLPKSSRPLDILRAKSRPDTIPLKITSKSELNRIVVPGCEESQPLGAKTTAPSSPFRTTQTRKKPLFIDVSDSDSDIEVSDIRRPSSSTTTSIAAGDGENGSATTSVGIGNIRPTYTIGTPVSRLPSKLDRVPLSRSSSESEEKINEGDELPTFHRGSAMSRAKKAAKATDPVYEPTPRPFSMHFASEPPTSSCDSRFTGKDDGNDEVEFADVFATPRGPSPPRSPTPSPSPFNALRLHTSIKPAAFVKTCRCVSLDRDTPLSGDEKVGVHKSPRKSAAHSSPRHNSRVRERASSPTPSEPSPCDYRADGAALYSDARECGEPNSCGPRQGSGSDYAAGAGERLKHRPGDTSVMYIPSGSEGEDSTQRDVGIGRGGGGIDRDPNEWSDLEVNRWADTGMILSAPPSPSPACAPPSPGGDPVPSVPPVEVFAEPKRASKFKPAPTAALGADARAPSAKLQVCDRVPLLNLKDTKHNEDTTALCRMRRAPLLVARTKRSKGIDSDVIDLTSD